MLNYNLRYLVKHSCGNIHTGWGSRYQAKEIWESLNSRNSRNAKVENSQQQINTAIALLKRWLNDPDENNIVSDTYHFICNYERNI